MWDASEPWVDASASSFVAQVWTRWTPFSRSATSSNIWRMRSGNLETCAANTGASSDVRWSSQRSAACWASRKCCVNSASNLEISSSDWARSRSDLLRASQRWLTMDSSASTSSLSTSHDDKNESPIDLLISAATPCRDVLLRNICNSLICCSNSIFLKETGRITFNFSSAWSSFSKMVSRASPNLRQSSMKVCSRRCRFAASWRSLFQSLRVFSNIFRIEWASRDW